MPEPQERDVLNDLPGSSLILVYASSALASDELLDELLHPRVIVAVVGIQALIVRVAAAAFPAALYACLRPAAPPAALA